MQAPAKLSQDALSAYCSGVPSESTLGRRAAAGLRRAGSIFGRAPGVIPLPAAAAALTPSGSGQRSGGADETRAPANIASLRWSPSQIHVKDAAGAPSTASGAGSVTSFTPNFMSVTPAHRRVTVAGSRPPVWAVQEQRFRAGPYRQESPGSRAGGPSARLLPGLLAAARCLLSAQDTFLTRPVRDQRGGRPA